MAFTKYTESTNIIRGLSDNPNQSDGLTAAQLKALFDKFADTMSAFVNNVLIAELEKTTSISGSQQIGSATIAGIDGNTVYDQLVSLLDIVQDAQAGVIVDGSITDAKLSDSANQIKDKVSRSSIRMQDNWKTPSDLPSAYPLGETTFFDLNNAWGSSVGFSYPTIKTIKSLSGGAAIHQFAYNYSGNTPLMKVRKASESTDTWGSWASIQVGDIYSFIPLFSGGATGAWGGRIKLLKPTSDSTVAGNIIMESYGNKVNIFEDGGGYRGAYFDITECSNNSGAKILHSGNDGRVMKAVSSSVTSGAITDLPVNTQCTVSSDVTGLPISGHSWYARCEQFSGSTAKKITVTTITDSSRATYEKSCVNDAWGNWILVGSFTKSATIPTSGWGSTGRSDFPYYYNISSAWIRALDRVDVNAAIESSDVVQNAGISGSVKSYDGYVQIWAKAVPTSSIGCEITISRGV